MEEDGYLKFYCVSLYGQSRENITELNQWRNVFYELHCIGQHSDGKGYGNISKRSGRGFIITGTQTGGIRTLTKAHYTEVIDGNLDENDLICQGCGGQIEASSESPTHKALYDTLRWVNAVIHIHHLELWEKLLNQVPTTSSDAKYGTPEIAYEAMRLCKLSETQEKKIITMAGHKEGILALGRSLDEAGNNLLRYLQN